MDSIDNNPSTADYTRLTRCHVIDDYLELLPWLYPHLMRQCIYKTPGVIYPMTAHGVAILLY